MCWCWCCWCVWVVGVKRGGGERRRGEVDLKRVRERRERESEGKEGGEKEGGREGGRAEYERASAKAGEGCRKVVGAAWPPPSPDPLPPIPPPKYASPYTYPLSSPPHFPLPILQGRLVRTILFASEHATANTRDAAIFVSCLLAFALAAAGYVLSRGLADERRRRTSTLSPHHSNHTPASPPPPISSPITTITNSGRCQRWQYEDNCCP